MKKVFKFVKGKKEAGAGITPSQSKDLSSPAQTPEDERFLSLDTSSGYIVDFCGKDKTLTKLHKAAWQGHLEKLKAALKKVEIDAVDRHNRSALHFAVSQGHPNIVWFLLGNNAKMTICDDYGCTPLLKAVECGHKDCMALLLERGADINNSDYQGNTGLHLAAKQGNLDIASALLTRGAAMDLANNSGEYPLHIATRSQNKDLVELFLRTRASVNVCDRENRTPLMLAAKTGNLLLTQLFFEYGADLSIVDSNGWTAEDYALLGGHETVANTLKSFAKSSKSSQLETYQEEDETIRSNEEPSTWNDDSGPLQANESTLEVKEDSGQDKEDDLSDSPNSNAMPPPCQPPRSWEMIQAGMIDTNQEGSESKRRSITALGTLHSRRESFTEAQGDAAKYTLSLNRRKGVKRENSFAKQRLSFNEEESLKSWITDSSSTLKEIDKMDLDKILKVDGTDGINDKVSVKGGNSASIHAMSPLRESSVKQSSPCREALNGTEEVWVANAQVMKTAVEETDRSSWDSEELNSQEETNFPPPPSGIELGVNMARSLGCMKGISIDQPVSMILEGKARTPMNVNDASKDECFHGRALFGSKRHVRHESISSQKWRSEEIPQNNKYADRLVDVNRRINEQLQCYDQALKELAETPYAKKQEVIVSALEKPSTAVNYYSLPASKHRTAAQKGEGRGGDNYYYDWSKPPTVSSGPLSLPFSVNDSLDSEQQMVEETTTKSSKDPVQETKKSKRHMLLAMRDVKHAVQVTNSFKTSADDQILSPLAKPPDTSDSDSEPSPKEREPHFFRSGAASARQETVIERPGFSKSSSSEEPTLWLQDKKEEKEAASSLGSSSTHSGQGLPTPKPLNEECFERGSRRNSTSSDRSRISGGRPDDESGQVLRNIPSPDVSFSSGPIEGGKDSGSDADTSHNDISPTHNYTLQTHHEWLKNHLKTATTEKNKLEQIAVELSEKAERLQYELADAKEATKSKDEVIHLLQSQLARMESAYTKSLEESVQSRLQMTTHEQEILHLKELCFRYEEEKERLGVEGEESELVDLKSRIRVLEEEKEKLTKDVLRLEHEKSSLEKRLQEATTSEIIDQCQRWKERFGNLEESAKANDESQTAYLSYLKSLTEEHRGREAKLAERNAELEKMLFEAKEKNTEVEARLRNLLAETESEKLKISLQKELSGSVTEISKKNLEIEAQMRRLEKDVEEKNLSIMKQKEEEMQKLIKQFAEEREAIIKNYERTMVEKSSEKTSREREDTWKKENERLKKTITLLQEQFTNLRDEESEAVSKKSEHSYRVSESANELQQKEKEKIDLLEKENLSLRKEVSELKIKLMKDDQEKPDYKRDLLKVVSDHTNVRSEMIELKNQMQGLEKTLSSERKLLQEYKEKNAGLEEQIMKITAEEKQTQRPEGNLDMKQNKRRGAGRDDELAWTNLYGIKRANKTREDCDFFVRSDIFGTGENRDQNFVFEKSRDDFRQRLDANFRTAEEKKLKQSEQSSEFLELRRQIIVLQNKVTEEKSTRTSLENKLSEMEAELQEKERLKQEVISLRRRIERDFVPKLEVEVVKLERDLERRRYREESSREASGQINPSDYKAKCERFAKEMEKSKEIRRRIEDTSEDALTISRESKERGTADVIRASGPPPSGVRPQPVQLEPELKSRLNEELDRSIKKHLTDIGIVSDTEVEHLKNKLLQ